MIQLQKNANMFWDLLMVKSFQKKRYSNYPSLLWASKSRAETLCSVQGIALIIWGKNGEKHIENF